MPSYRHASRVKALRIIGQARRYTARDDNPFDARGEACIRWSIRSELIGILVHHRYEMLAQVYGITQAFLFHGVPLFSTRYKGLPHRYSYMGQLQTAPKCVPRI